MPDATAEDTTIPQPKKSGGKKKADAPPPTPHPAATADALAQEAADRRAAYVDELSAIHEALGLGPDESRVDAVRALKARVAELEAALKPSSPPPSTPPADADEHILVHDDERSFLGFVLPRKKGKAPKMRIAFDVDLEASDLEGLLGKGDKLNRSRAGLIIRSAVNALKAAISKGLSVRIEGGI
jgi:hypothetical protein